MATGEGRVGAGSSLGRVEVSSASVPFPEVCTIRFVLVKASGNWIQPFECLCSPPSDLRQELAVRERQQEVTRKSAPSSPTLDCEKMDSAVQASLSLPATPVGKGSENSFPSPKGRIGRNCLIALVGCSACYQTVSDQILVCELKVWYVWISCVGCI